MANNEPKVVITAEDRTAQAFASVNRGLKDMQDRSDLANRALSAIGVTLSAATIVAFVKGTIDAADGLNDLSQRVGINIQQLAGWTLAANQSGTSMESVAKGIKGLSTYMVEHGAKLRAAGITATDANGAMTQLADLFHAMPDGVQKTALAVQLFGKAGMDMIPVLNQGSKGLAEAQEKAAAYGKKMAELAPQADEFNDLVAELGLNAKAAGINITSYFMPGLIGMSQWLNDIASGGEKAQQAVSWLTGERTMKAMALAGHPGLAGGAPREVRGKIGGQKAPGLTSAEEDALGERNLAGLRAAGLLDNSPSAHGKKSHFDPEGDFDLKFAQMNERAKRAGFDARDKAIEAEADRIEKLRQKYIGMADPLQQYRIQLDEVRLLREKGILSADQALEAEWKINEALDASKDKLSEFKGSGVDAFSELSKAIESWGSKAADTFADFVVDGKASFSDLVNSMLKDVARLQAKQVLDPITRGANSWLSSALGNLFGGGGGPTSVVLHGGGIVGSEQAGFRSLPPMAFAGAPRYHSGGIAGDEVPAILRKGEGVFTPGQMAALGGSGGGDSVTIHQTVSISVGVAQTVRAEVLNMLPQIQAASRAAVMDARLRGGSTRAAFRG